MDAAAQPTGWRWKHVEGHLTASVRTLDAFNAEIMRSGGAVARETSGVIERALGVGTPSQRGPSDPVACEISTAVNERLQALAAERGQTPTHCECATSLFGMVGEFVRAMSNNGYDSCSGRWVANVANVGFRTGVIVLLTTTLRQLLGFLIEKSIENGEGVITVGELPGVITAVLGMGMNVAGLARDERNHTATVRSRCARTAMLMLSATALITAHLVQTKNSGSVLASLLRSYGPQMLIYTLSRDIVQSFVYLQDNASVNVGGAVAGAISYGLMQTALSVLVDDVAPHSGAGFAMAMAVSPEVGHDLMRGVINAAGEVYDDIVRPLLNLFFRVVDTETSQRFDLTDLPQPAASMPGEQDGVEGLRIRLGIRRPTATELADQFLTTSAMRTSALQIVISCSLIVGELLARTELPIALQHNVGNLIAGACAAFTYAPFALAHDRQPPRPEGRGDVGAASAASPHPEPAVLLRRRSVHSV